MMTRTDAAVKEGARAWRDRWIAAGALALFVTQPALAQEAAPEGGYVPDAQPTLIGRADADDPFAGTPLPSSRPAFSPDDSAAGDPPARDEEAAAEIRRSVARIGRVEAQNMRATAVGARDRALDEDPYAPLGLRLGTWIVRPSLEQGLAWTSNASAAPDGRSAVLSETTLRLDAVSDWSRHSAAVSAYGAFRKSLSSEDVSDPEGGFDADLILDLGNEFRGSISAEYDLQPESAASPVELPSTTSRPLRQTFTVGAGLEKAAGKLRIGLTGGIERQNYGNAELTGGGELSQRERDFLLTTAVLRAGYEVSPALTPFLEAELGRRAYDLAADSNGYDRSALRTGLRAGFAFDLGEKFFGEISAGWLRENLDDPRLPSVSAASVTADLFWSPKRGTVIGLQATTAVEGATAPGESGSVLYAGRLSLERRMRANLTGSALLGLDWRNYAGSSGHDLTLSAQAGLTYWLNRYAGLTGRARHETVKSSEPGREAETNSVFLGLRLQR